MRLNILLVLCLLGTSIFAQKQIQVLDSITREPLGYASIQLLQNSKGTITNSAGYFVVNSTDLPSMIRVFFVGYETKQVYWEPDNIPKFLVLSPSNVALGEVVVRADEALKIMKAAYKKLKANSNKIAKAKSFFRLTSFQQNEYTELIECYFDSYLNSSGIKSWDFTQGRYALLKDASKRNLVASIDFSMINRYLDISNAYNQEVGLPDFPFRPHFNRYFYFTITERYLSNGDEIVGIKYEPKKDLYGSFFTGMVYINSKTFRVLKIEGRSNMKSKGFIRPNTKNGQVSDMSISVQIQFNSEAKLPVPTTVDFELTYQYANLLNQQKHKVKTKSTLLHYYHDSMALKPKNVPIDEAITDYGEIATNLYLPQFWSQNDVLAATPLEEKARKNFEKSASFGKAFNNSDDTLLIKSEGFEIWSATNTFSAEKIKAEKPNDLRIESIVLRRFDELNEQTDTVAGLYTDMYFVWNCYRDTFYFRILPLFDLNASFIIPELKSDSKMNYLCKAYFNLCKAYCCKLEREIQRLSNPCENKDQVRAIYYQLNNLFFEEKIQLLNEVWGRDALSKWESIIDADLGANCR